MRKKLFLILNAGFLFSTSVFSSGWDQATCESFGNIKKNVVPEAPSMNQGHAGLCASFAMGLAISKAKGLSGSDSISPLSLAKSVENWKNNSESGANKSVEYFPAEESSMRKQRMKTALESKFRENKYGVSKGGSGAVNDGGDAGASFGVDKYSNVRMEGVTLDELAQAALSEAALCRKENSTFAGESVENWTKNGKTNYTMFTDQKVHEKNSGDVSQLMGSISNLYMNSKHKRYDPESLKNVFEESRKSCDRDIKAPIKERLKQVCNKFNNKRKGSGYYRNIIKPCNTETISAFMDANMDMISNSGGTTDLMATADNLSSKFVKEELISKDYLGDIKERGELNLLVDFEPKNLNEAMSGEIKAIKAAERKVIETEKAYQEGLEACQNAEKKRQKEELCKLVKRGSPVDGELLRARNIAKNKTLPDAKYRLNKLKKDKEDIDGFIGSFLTKGDRVDVMSLINKELEKEGVAAIGESEKAEKAQINKERIEVLKQKDPLFAKNEEHYQKKYQDLVDRIGRVRAIQVVDQIVKGKSIRSDDRVVLEKAREIAPFVKKRKERIQAAGSNIPRELKSHTGTSLTPVKLDNYLKRKVAEGSTNGTIVYKAQLAREGVMALEVRSDLLFLRNCWGRQVKPCNTDSVEKRRKSLLETLKKHKVSEKEVQAFSQGGKAYRNHLTNPPQKYLDILESGDIQSEEAGSMLFHMQKDFRGTVNFESNSESRTNLGELHGHDYQNLLDLLLDTEKARKRKDRGMAPSKDNLLKIIADDSGGGASSELALAMLEHDRDLRRFNYDERENIKKHSLDLQLNNYAGLIEDAAKKYENYNQCMAEEIEDRLLQKYSKNGRVQCRTDNDVIHAMTSLSNLTDDLGKVLGELNNNPNPFWNKIIDCKDPADKVDISDLKMTAYKMKDEQLQEYPVAQKEARLASAIKESLAKDIPMVVGLCLGMFKDGCKKGDGHAMAVVGMKSSWDGSKCNVSYKLKNSWGDNCSRTQNASKGISCDKGLIDVPHDVFVQGAAEVLSVSK